MNKICKKCCIEKDINEFSCKSYLCKICYRDYMKSYKEKNKAKLNEYNKNWMKKKRNTDPEYRKKENIKQKEYNTRKEKKYKEKNILTESEYKNRRAEYQKTYKEKKKNELKEYAKKWQYEKRATDPLHKLKHTISTAIRGALKKKGYRKSGNTEAILGCSYEEFKIYLEKQFEFWMTYDNHGICEIGKYNVGWDIDHIIPIDTATSEAEVIALNHYTNLRPLCSYTNRYIKRNKTE